MPGVSNLGREGATSLLLYPLAALLVVVRLILPSLLKLKHVALSRFLIVLHPLSHLKQVTKHKHRIGQAQASCWDVVRAVPKRSDPCMQLIKGPIRDVGFS